jgi:hypothetical protein
MATHHVYLNEEASMQNARDERPSYSWLCIEQNAITTTWYSVVWYGAPNNLYARIFTILSILADAGGTGAEVHQDMQLQLSSEHDVFSTMSA